MLHNTVIIVDLINRDSFIYFTKDYVTACDFISQKLRRNLKHWVEGKDYVIFHGSEIELSDNFIEKNCINIQPGVDLLLY